MTLEFCQFGNRADFDETRFLESFRQKDSINHEDDVETQFQEKFILTRVFSRIPRMTRSEKLGFSVEVEPRYFRDAQCRILITFL